MEIDILGTDLAKQIFQLHGADRRGRVLHRAKVSRGSLFESVRTLKPRLVVMEACSSAHHLARRFPVTGNRSPAYQPPIHRAIRQDEQERSQRCGGDRRATSRPTMRFVPVKSVEQQDIQAAHRMCATLLRHRTALIDQMRGLLANAVSQSPGHRKSSSVRFRNCCAQADELTSFCRTLLTELLVHLRAIEERIHFIEISIHSFMK